ncbi:twin-arginine translocation signal domain-containing protein [Arthrobacter sp. ISL-65]|uniref:twin-arginine translocation signal domain-containing protein n=1 Tax=Arthrobacter sp. ISL-65 TaxID=2819112 RepID=UPI001BE8AF45|nr:twin-arginine translocation signal domain-containing protein [Arthrobacter sp. ISL-65]
MTTRRSFMVRAGALTAAAALSACSGVCLFWSKYGSSAGNFAEPRCSECHARQGTGLGTCSGTACSGPRICTGHIALYAGGHTGCTAGPAYSFAPRRRG